MEDLYLSPAFSARSPEDRAFLRQIDGAAGFSLFWIDIVRPLLQATDARHLVQVGAYTGEHTRLLLDYCLLHEGFLTVVEPFVLPELEEILRGHPGCRLIRDKSHTAIPCITEPFDVLLLNGDLNYHTVLGDLRAIDETAARTGMDFPTVVLKSMSWPYARRDMYYDPEALPTESRYDCCRMGMVPWSPGLEERAINAPYCNAVREGGKRNGVRTAVEDFLSISGERLALFTLPINYGLGIIYRPGTTAADFIDRMIAPPPALRLLLETWEISRLNDIIGRLRPPAGDEDRLTGLLRRLRRLVGRLRR